LLNHQGKSTFVARIVEGMRKGAFDTVHSAFIGAVEGSTSVVRLLNDMCHALSADDGQPDNAVEYPRDLSGLASMFAELLASLSSKGNKVLIAIDALNELETGRALSWLP
jgi:hypothetical protein